MEEYYSLLLASIIIITSTTLKHTNLSFWIQVINRCIIMGQVKRRNPASKEKGDDSAGNSDRQQAVRSSDRSASCSDNYAPSAIRKLCVEIITLSKVKIGGAFYILDRPIELTSINVLSSTEDTAAMPTVAKKQITRSSTRGSKKTTDINLPNNSRKKAPAFGPSELISIVQTSEAAIYREVHILTDVDVLSARPSVCWF